MKRPLLTICLAVFTALAMPAAAQDTATRVQEAIIAQLSSQGFTRVRISHTLLGRVRIVATAPGTTREIIFNPRTGEILRDYWDDEDEFSGGLISSSRSDDRDGASPRGGSDDSSDKAGSDSDRDKGAGDSGDRSGDDGKDDRGARDDDSSSGSDDKSGDDHEKDDREDKSDGEDKEDGKEDGGDGEGDD